MEACWAHNPKVVGSNPSLAIFSFEKSKEKIKSATLHALSQFSLALSLFNKQTPKNVNAGIVSISGLQNILMSFGFLFGSTVTDVRAIQDATVELLLT